MWGYAGAINPGQFEQAWTQPVHWIDLKSRG
jgi:hypothetical protein